MTDMYQLGLEVRSDGVVVASNRLNQLAADGARAESATNSLSSSFAGMTKYINAAVAAFASFQLAQYAKEATMLAARVETLGVVLKVVGNNAGYTGSQMDAYDKAVQKMGKFSARAMQYAVTLYKKQGGQ
jgi:hypothetical protein